MKRNTGYADWEYGFRYPTPDKDGKQKSAENPIHEFQVDHSGRSRNYYTRSQWKKLGRIVNVSDEQAVKTIQTREGRTLRLFALEQTREL